MAFGSGRWKPPTLVGGAGSLEPAKTAAPIQFWALAQGPEAVDFITLSIYEIGSRWLYKSRKQYPLPFSTSPPPEQERREYDIIRQYFELPQSLDNFEIVTRAIDQGIGVFEMRKRFALWDLFNPLYWFSLVLRAPLWVLYRAGFPLSQKFYEGFIKTVFGAVLILVLIHYGKLGWNDLKSWLFSP